MAELQGEAAAIDVDALPEPYDPSTDPARRSANSKDPGWNYGFWPDLEHKDIIQCKLCKKRVRAGVGRLKRHLAGGYNDLEKCPKATKEIREEMHEYLKRNSSKFRSMEKQNSSKFSSMEDID